MKSSLRDLLTHADVQSYSVDECGVWIQYDGCVKIRYDWARVIDTPAEIAAYLRKLAAERRAAVRQVQCGTQLRKSETTRSVDGDITVATAMEWADDVDAIADWLAYAPLENGR